MTQQIIRSICFLPSISLHEFTISPTDGR